MGSNASLIPSLKFFTNPEGYLLDLHESHGPAFRVRLGGMDYTVLIGDEARTHYLEHGEACMGRRAFFGGFANQLGSEFFVLAARLDDPKYQVARPLLRLAFSRETAKQFVPDFVRLTEQWCAGLPVGGVTRITEEMGRLAFSQYGFVLAERDLGPFYEDARLFGQTAMEVATRFLPPIAHHRPRYQRARTNTLALLDDLMHTRRQGEGRLTVLEVMDQARSGPNALSHEEVRSCALYGFIGATIYISRLMGLVLYELTRNPAINARAVEEADRAFAGGGPTSSSLRQMVFIRAVIHEAIRRHPIAFGLPFQADEDFEFSGFRVPAGSDLLVSTLPAHFDPNRFNNPWMFDPDRFLEPRREHRGPGNFLPWGVGKRICAAVGLVETMTLATVATLLRNVEFALEKPSYQLKIVPAPLPGPDPSFSLRLAARRTPPDVTDVAPGEEDVGILGDVDLSLVDDLLRRVEPVQFPADSFIMKEGDAAEHFYILTAGKVEVTQHRDGEDVQLRVLGPGDCFGERGLLNGGTRTATIRCLEAPVEALAMDSIAFRETVIETDLLSEDVALLVRRHYITRGLANALPLLNSKDINSAALESTLDELCAGDVIIQQGDPAETFHVVVEGTVDVVQDADGVEHQLATLQPGEFFGELGLILGRPRSATVRAGADGTKVVTVSREAFEMLMKESEGTKASIMLALLGHVNKALDA